MTELPKHCGMSTCTAPSCYVSDSPKNTKVLINTKGDIMEGHVVNLTCISNANPPVKRYTWYKVIGGQPWAKGSSQNLTFTSVRSHHAGQYYCTVWNILGMGMSPPVTLSVLCKCSLCQVIKCTETAFLYVLVRNVWSHLLAGR